MVATVDKVFAGSIPELYERLMVPLIFERYARDLAARLAKTNPRAVLETAAGTGVLTRALAGPSGRDAHDRDRSQPADARPRGSAAACRRPDRVAAGRRAGAAVRGRSFDAVACQFGAMFFPDKVQGYTEARRVLKPGGRFFFNVWDRIEANEFADVITQELAAVFPNDPPRFWPARRTVITTGSRSARS